MGKELSKQTRQNWQINAFLLLSAILTSLSGIYFLYFPEGFKGGRNPLYNVTIIFNRTTWDLIHTWSGVAMIAIAIFHIMIHWKWIRSMTKKVWNEMLAGKSKISKFGKINVLINFMRMMNTKLRPLLIKPLVRRSWYEMKEDVQAGLEMAGEVDQRKIHNEFGSG